MKRLVVSAAAARDLSAIWDYTYEFAESTRRADHVVRQLYEAFGLLAEFPTLGGMRDRFGPGVLAFEKHGYLILYRIRDEQLEILRVSGAHEDLLLP